MREEEAKVKQEDLKLRLLQEQRIDRQEQLSRQPQVTARSTSFSASGRFNLCFCYSSNQIVSFFMITDELWNFFSGLMAGTMRDSLSTALSVFGLYAASPSKKSSKVELNFWNSLFGTFYSEEGSAHSHHHHRIHHTTPEISFTNTHQLHRQQQRYGNGK
jgi:hypothetical protein